jgi:predicted dehydrogenase
LTNIPVKVGVIGCGNISGTYLKNARMLEPIEVVACADLVPQRAAAKAAEFGIPRACSVDELLADAEIEIVLNLTTPQAHAEIALAALEAGKSIYNEKPLAIFREDGARILETARSKDLRVGCAPDTFLGSAGQTARSLIDDGAIGEPVAATAFVVCHGHEHWHPDPEFLYQAGGGPLFDMGPYYLTALVNLLGPLRRVTGSARITFPERTVTSSPKRGKRIKVETPTHITDVLEFASGVVGTMITSFDVWHASLPFIEIYGSSGSLNLPDPNCFGGPLRLRRAGDAAWSDIPQAAADSTDLRGLGLADMAQAMGSGRSHRASGELAYHVLDVMHAVCEASDLGRHVAVGSACQRPAPLPPGLAPAALDD